MPIYYVIVWGRNCLLEYDGRVQRLGFFATRSLVAANAATAAKTAIDSVRSEFEGCLLNPPDAPPVFAIEEIAEADELRGPNKGATGYPDDDDA